MLKRPFYNNTFVDEKKSAEAKPIKIIIKSTHYTATLKKYTDTAQGNLYLGYGKFWGLFLVGKIGLWSTADANDLYLLFYSGLLCDFNHTNGIYSLHYTM